MHGAAPSASAVILGLSPLIVALSVFVLTYAVIVTERINRAIVALIGAGVMILTGVLHQSEAFAGIDFNTIGLLTGILWADLERMHPEIWRQLHDTRRHVADPGEEGMDAFQRRVAAVLEDFCARHGDDQAVGIVSHGGTLSMLVCAALGIPPRRPQPFRLSNASLSILEIWARGPVLTLLNDTHHLDGLGGRP